MAREGSAADGDPPGGQPSDRPQPTTATSVPSGLPGLAERVAWAVPLSSRRLFLTLALTVVASVVLASVGAAWVNARNARTISEARETGLDIARAATEFRTNLASADAQAATALLAGGLETPETRDRYETDLLLTSDALTEAGIVATQEDIEDIHALSEGLLTYHGLVHTARANSRQGHPVGTSYLNEARSFANGDLVPRSDRLRRVGERRVADAANSVGGPAGISAIAALALGLVVLLATATIVAGRTRRVAHPAGIAAALALLASLGVVTVSILSQGHELRRAATTDVQAYIDANGVAFRLSSLRVTEIGAVAAHGTGKPLYDQFRSDAEELADRFSGNPERRDTFTAVENYVAAVEGVESTDLSSGDNRAAATDVLEGESAATFELANAEATTAVDQAGVRLQERFNAAADAGRPVWIPLVLGGLAAALAGGGVLVRGRGYR